MLTTRLKIAGTALSIAVLFAGHSVPVHADATGDALAFADATAANSVEFTTALAANAGDPDTTCDPVAAGGPANSNVDVNVANQVGTQVAAHDAAVGSVTCFSFSHLNYTMWASLWIQDRNPSTGAWVNTGCSAASGPVPAVAGLATSPPLVVTCPYPINFGTTAQHIHRALLRFNTSSGKNGVPQPSANTWTISY